MSNRKVVELSSNVASATRPKRVSRLSLSVENVLNIYISELDQRLNELFTNADDHLFDKSSKSDDSRHFAAMRTLRVEKSKLLTAFQSSLKSQFIDTIGKIEGQALFEGEEEEISFDNLALVEEEELEERIALDSMTTLAQKNNKLALDNIAQRLDVLVPSVTVTEEINPFEPGCVCTAFSQSINAVELGVEFKLVLYKFFERTVIEDLELIYDKINEYFIEHGILPDLKRVPVKQSKRERFAKSARETPSDSKTMQELSEENAEILGLLSELLSERRSGQASSVPQAVETTQLVDVLSNLQKQMASQAPAAGQDLRSQIGSFLPANVGEQVNQGALGRANDDMIDVVTMLFDFILDDENLHSEIKALIARLQIPILKVGLTDKTFFSNRKHPARLLLNELARGGLAWEPNDKSSEPLLKKIQYVVEQICNEFTEEVGFFEDLLAEFVKFKDEFRRRADIFERRTRESEEGKAKAESARAKVNQEIKKICYKKHVPQVARQILRSVWVHVMFLQSLKDDQEGWEKVAKIARMLIWSLQPIKDQERLSKIKKVIPIVIKNLKFGFDKISFSEIEASTILDNLEDAHREVITNGKLFIEEDSKDEIIRLQPADPFAEKDESKIEENSDQVEEHFEPVDVEEIAFTAEEIGIKATAITEFADIEVTAENLQTIENLGAGSWIDLKLNDEFKRCKLAAKIASTGRYIFVNREGVKVAEYLTPELAAVYQQGHLKVLDDEALFDRALKSVISNLRDMKSTA